MTPFMAATARSDMSLFINLPIIMAGFGPDKRPYSEPASWSNLWFMRPATQQQSMSYLIPRDYDHVEPASNEVQFALVIARMVETVRNSPEHMRQAVYDLARYKLREQFTDANEEDIRRARQALESAIRGVEEFSRQSIDIPPPRVPQLGDGSAAQRFPAADHDPPVWVREPTRQTYRPAANRSPPDDSLWPIIKRTAAVLVILGGVVLGLMQRERLTSFVQSFSNHQRQIATNQPPPTAPVIATPAPPPARPNPLRPTDYGVYGIVNDALAELQPLPGRAPDIRVAVSAAMKIPSHTILPNGHPKFIVFRRDLATGISDRFDVRIVARIAREFSTEVAGRKPEDGDTWVIRNVSFPFRASPLADTPDMYELHSEDPALELTPGRYALVLKNQAYEFSVDGTIVDPQQCIERVVATNGTFYTNCKKP
jgi:hypothetical protein